MNAGVLRILINVCARVFRLTWCAFERVCGGELVVRMLKESAAERGRAREIPLLLRYLHWGRKC